MSSRPSTVTGAQQALNKCLLKAGMLNVRDGRGKEKRKRRKRRVGKEKQERKGGERQKNKEIN